MKVGRDLPARRKCLTKAGGPDQFEGIVVIEAGPMVRTVVSGGSGESGSIFNGVNSALGGFGLGAGPVSEFE